MAFVYLLLSVLSSSVLTVLFKWYGSLKVDVFQAIVWNYFVCALTGMLMLQTNPLKFGVWNEPWFPYTILLGAIFILGFNVAAKTVEVFGVGIGGIAQRMSLLISVPFAIIYYNESVNAMKILGLVLALVAVILVNKPKDTKAFKEGPGKYLYLIFLIILIAGGLEILLQYIEVNVVSQAEDPSASIFMFWMAALMGCLFWLGQIAKGDRYPFNKNSLWAGVLLGVPNYFSIYFLMLVLGEWEGSVVLPINNVAIIGLSVLFGILLFKERLTLWNFSGVFLAVLAILLIGFA